MSGGSFNYICWKEGSDLFEPHNVQELERMVDTLEVLGYEDAARETYDLIRTIKQARIRVSTMHDRLSEVFHAVEWYESGDSSPERIEEAIKNYRGAD